MFAFITITGKSTQMTLQSSPIFSHTESGLKYSHNLFASMQFITLNSTAHRSYLTILKIKFLGKYLYYNKYDIILN